MYYAGIGSRVSPDNILALMTLSAMILETKGYTLRSGGAEGADTAFANGTSQIEIFRPNDATPEAIKLASTVHPKWDNCNDYVRKLHGRNAQIILGRNLDKPVEFVICWTKNAKGSGGTGLGIRIAKLYGITVYDLGSRDAINKIVSVVRGNYE